MNAKLSDEDRQLWESLAQTVTPLDPASRAEISVEASGRRKRAMSGKAVAGSADSSLVLSRSREGGFCPAERSSERRVRRGQYEPEASLDLHGHTISMARSALAGFVARARQASYACVLVITGKGRKGGGVLRVALPEMLKSPDIARHVGGYAQAHRRHGGEGAYYLFLRKA